MMNTFILKTIQVVAGAARILLLMQRSMVTEVTIIAVPKDQDLFTLLVLSIARPAQITSNTQGPMILRE